MNRRTFLKQSGLLVLSVGVVGSIQKDLESFVGDTPTTTDILGPFYRPGAPIRTNINSPDYSGELVHLQGTVYEKGGKNPLQNCLIEIWQCDHNMVYDNTSDEYRYRGAQKTPADGQYHFITAMPVPYPRAADSNFYRPAHIHLRLSGQDQYDLITQIYFKGDPNIAVDPCASSPNAIHRILNVSTDAQNEKTIHFDVVMAKLPKPDDPFFNKVIGLYVMNDNSIIEFERNGEMLFMKWNGQIREAFTYQGNNQFAGGMKNHLSFEFPASSESKVKVRFVTVAGKEFNLDGVRSFKYIKA